MLPYGNIWGYTEYVFLDVTAWGTTHEGQGQNTVTWIWSEYEHYVMVPMKENVCLNGWVHTGGALLEAV